jgi:hypothetical protein
MRLIRQIHLYLGCLFAPLLIYFALSGTWQLYHLNGLPKDAPATQMQTVLHALSAPHTHSTFPGGNPKEDRSKIFAGFALLTAIGLIVSTVLGILLAIRFGKSRGWVYVALASGALLPIIFLLIH